MAIDGIRPFGRVDDSRFPQQSGPPPLWVVAQRIVEIPSAVLVVDKPRQPLGMGAGGARCSSETGYHADDGADEPAIFRELTACAIHTGHSRLGSSRDLRRVGLWI